MYRLKKYIPFAKAKSIYDIDVSFFLKLKIKYLFLDLDNTLDSYKNKEPSQRAIELKNLMEENGIKIYIISNNTGKRVQNYASLLGVSYLDSVRKPFTYKIKKFMKENKISCDDVIFVGDQLLTDIAMSNKTGIKSIYVDKLVKEDQITTRLNRIFERSIRRRLEKKHLFINWEEINNG